MAPIVHEYTADSPVAGPFDTRQARNEDSGNVGNALSRLGNTAGQVGDQIQKRDAQAEISDLQPKLSQANADFTMSLDTTFQNADPSDRTVADQYLQDYDDKMGEIGDNLQTPQAQQYFNQQNAQMRAHFQVAAYKNQANLAGENAVQNLNTTVDSNSAALIQDPSSFEHVRQMQEDAIQAQVDSGLIPQNKGDSLQAAGETQLAKNAIQGWINIGAPEKALADLKAGNWSDYLNGDETFQMMKVAEQGVRGKQMDAALQQKQAGDALASQQGQTQNNFLAGLHNGTLTAKQVLNSNLDPFGSGSKDQFLKLIDQNIKGPNDTDPQIYHNLIGRIFAPDTDPQKITDPNTINNYIANGSLSLDDGIKLRNQVARTPDAKREQTLKSNFLKMAQSTLVKPDALGMKDPQGMEQYQAFTSDFLPAYDQARQAGKTPQQLLDPKSPDYMGNMIRPYIKTPQQKMNDTAALLQQQSQLPKAGDVEGGYRFKGGNPSDKNAWEKVQ